MQAGQVLEQGCYECFSKTARRPLFEFTEVQNVANDREASKHARSHEYVRTLNFHARCLYLLLWALLGVRLSCRNVETAASDKYMQLYPDEANRFAAPGAIH